MTLSLRAWVDRMGKLQLGAGALVVLVLVLIIGVAVAAFMAQSADMQDALHRLATYRAEAALRPALEAEVKSARQKLVTLPGQVTGTSTPLAQASLQSAVKTQVDESGGEIHSAQVIPATRASGFETIAVQYDLVVPVTHLRALAYAIESGTPYLFIDEADITMPQNWQPGNPQAPEPEVEVRWTIHGYRWVGAR